MYIYICGNRINLVHYSEFHALCNHQVYNFISISLKKQIKNICYIKIQNILY